MAPTCRSTSVESRLVWPEDELESVVKCPTCSHKSRKLLYSNLTDKVFFCAPGKWVLYRCQSCLSAFIDPRPSAKAIYRAYQNYFTHLPPANLQRTSTP